MVGIAVWEVVTRYRVQKAIDTALKENPDAIQVKRNIESSLKAGRDLMEQIKGTLPIKFQKRVGTSDEVVLFYVHRVPDET